LVVMDNVVFVDAYDGDADLFFCPAPRRHSSSSILLLVDRYLLLHSSASNQRKTEFVLGDSPHRYWVQSSYESFFFVSTSCFLRERFVSVVVLPFCDKIDARRKGVSWLALVGRVPVL
jgi:hypothetical protein